MLTIYIIIFIGIVCVSLILYKKSKKENNLKKKILFSIPTLAYCFIIILIVLLFSGSQLNSVEKQVYNRFVDFVKEGDFFNPKEVRLLDVVVKYEYNDSTRAYSKNVERFYIKVLGTNKVGGTINKCYEIYYNDHYKEWRDLKTTCEDIYKTGLSYEQLSSNSIKKINKAIQKYWEDFGL